MSNELHLQTQNQSVTFWYIRNRTPAPRNWLRQLSLDQRFRPLVENLSANDPDIARMILIYHQASTGP